MGQRLTVAKTILPLLARTANGQSDPFDTRDFAELELFLDITAVSGTSPTLGVSVESRDPVSGKFVQIGAFPQKIAVGTDRLRLTNLGYEARVAWVLGGTTPSFTFSLGGVLKS